MNIALFTIIFFTQVVTETNKSDIFEAVERCSIVHNSSDYIKYIISDPTPIELSPSNIASITKSESLDDAYEKEIAEIEEIFGPRIAEIDFKKAILAKKFLLKAQEVYEAKEKLMNERVILALESELNEFTVESRVLESDAFDLENQKKHLLAEIERKYENERMALEEEGHYETSFSILDLAGLDDVRRVMVSYYSQYPDINPDFEATPVAIKYILMPIEYAWRNNITGVLHSLHGGGSSEILERRNLIRESLRLTIKHPELDWMSGLIIHAMGDAYAHTKNEIGTLQEEAYGPWVGHAYHSIIGRNPDKLTPNDDEHSTIVRNKYYRYINDLFETVKQRNAKHKVFIEEVFLRVINHECQENNNCPAFYREDAILSKRMDDIKECMNTSAKDLTKEHIIDTVNLIIADETIKPGMVERLKSKKYD